MEYYIISNNGSRDYNEDYACGDLDENKKSGFFVLADGLGGHGRGEVASQYVVNACIEYYQKNKECDHLIEKSIELAQSGLLQLQSLENAKSEMKTTLVVLQVKENRVCWGHVGDSRLYYFDKKKLISRTIDHSIPQMLALAGEIREKEIRKHPDRNKLLRVVGTEWEEPQYEVSEEIVVNDKSAFLLCTDGFWENITEKEMEKCLKKAKSVEEWLQRMNTIVQKRGKSADMDNNTALAVIL